jgi:hypothetical protein
MMNKSREGSHEHENITWWQSRAKEETSQEHKMTIIKSLGEHKNTRWQQSKAKEEGSWKHGNTKWKWLRIEKEGSRKHESTRWRWLKFEEGSQKHKTTLSRNQNHKTRMIIYSFLWNQPAIAPTF